MVVTGASRVVAHAAGMRIVTAIDFTQALVELDAFTHTQGMHMDLLLDGLGKVFELLWPGNLGSTTPTAFVFAVATAFTFVLPIATSFALVLFSPVGLCSWTPLPPPCPQWSGYLAATLKMKRNSD